MAKKYEELAERVVEELGGKDNITVMVLQLADINNT